MLVITALKDELDAFVQIQDGFDTWAKSPDESPPIYRRRFESVNGGRLDVAATWTAMGPTRAGTWIGKLVEQLKPSCIAMCGICAGWRTKTNQGDVVVARKAYQYDEGKLIGRKTKSSILLDLETFSPKQAWLSWIEDNKSAWSPQCLLERPLSLVYQENWFLRALSETELGEGTIVSEHPDRQVACPDFATVRRRLEMKRFIYSGKLQLTKLGRRRIQRILEDYGSKIKEDDPFRVHVGSFATGTKVVEDRSIFKNLSESGLRSTLAIEMEAVCLGVAAQISDIPYWLVVKSVQDYADDDKDDRFRDFACRTSAEFLLHCLKHLYPAAPHPINDLKAGATPKRCAS